MPSYKVYYSNHKGRAELIRWIFIQAGVKFEDVRFTREEWLTFKPNTPNGALPLLEIDGKLYGGSGPIARYVAEEYGLAGSNAQENLEIASIYDITEDILIRMAMFFEEKDETRKAELKKEFEEKHIPNYVGTLEKLITNNKSSGGWIYGDKVTYADLRVAQICDFIGVVCSADVLDAYPAVKKLKTAVEALPNIAKWIEERPKTQF